MSSFLLNVLYNRVYVSFPNKFHGFTLSIPCNFKLSVGRNLTRSSYFVVHKRRIKEVLHACSFRREGRKLYYRKPSGLRLVSVRIVKNWSRRSYSMLQTKNQKLLSVMISKPLIG